MMDLNVLPPEEEDKTSPKSSHVEHKETAVEISHREREERKQKLERERNDIHDDDAPITHAPKQAIRMNYDNDYNHYNKPFSFRSHDKTKLPLGWLECPSMGRDIYGFLPSKVPLGENFNDFIPPGKIYSFKQVFTEARGMNIHIGMVIDLTNTSRYYKVLEWKKYGINKHVKIPCKGRDSVPDNESVNRFVYEVSQFFSRQNDQRQRKHILVHCTHGYNRTGFMIVHYLARMLSIYVADALDRFAEARKPGIYKPDYIDALYTFYHENRPEVVTCPQTPDWKRSSVLDLDGDDDGDGTALVQERPEISEVMTDDDILGDNIPNEQQDAMRRFCYQVLKLKLGQNGVFQFPGSHPVSLDNGNLPYLRQRYYHATWKADGTRYMMLITLDGCYLIDRKFNFRRVQMRFPCRSSTKKDVPDKSHKTHHYTLLDGEMIIDSVPLSPKQIRIYLVYDIMAINHDSRVDYLFSERWELVEKEVIEPREHERELICSASKDCFYRYDMEPFGVRRKDFWPLSKVEQLLTKTIPTLSHKADGLIFQCWDDPYVPLTDERLLKWKYSHIVDFLFEMVDEQWLIYCFEKGKKKLIQGKIRFSNDIDPASFVGKIIECSCDSDEKVWVYMRLRPDKSTPNDINTYRKVLRSINDNITENVLKIVINDAIGLRMYVENLKKWNNKAIASRHWGGSNKSKGV